MSATPGFLPLPTDRLTPYAGQPIVAGTEPEALLQEHRSGVRAFLRRKGFTAEEADDLTQETLIRAYLHLPGFRGASLSAWLYRIAANVAVDYLRKRRVNTIPLESVTAVPGAAEEPWLRLDQEQCRLHLRSVIRLLPECHQRILQLRYYEDRSLAEIAELMSCSQMAAKLRVFRAVTALRKRWLTTGASAESAAG